MVSVRDSKKKLKKKYSEEETKLILSRECKVKTPPSKRRLEAIAKTITPLIFEKEGTRKYFNYCTHPAHQGILGKAYIEKKGCFKVDCSYYKKFYVK